MTYRVAGKIVTYHFCPRCGQRNVTFRIRSNGEDHYGCRTLECGWYAFIAGGGHDARLQDLGKANPDHFPGGSA